MQQTSVPPLKNRWLIALSAVGIHLSIGSVYSWSVFTKPLEAQFGWSLQELSITFSLAIVFLGLSAAFMGRWVERQGPRKAATLAAILFGTGLLGSGVAVSLRSLPLLYLTYGIIGGMGLGIGYISPVSTLVKWFPDKRGLATGLAIMGFGFASVIAGPLIARLLTSIGIPQTFFALGVAYVVIMLLSASYLALPPEGWLPANVKAKLSTGVKVLKDDLEQLTANEAIRTRRFWFLWLMLFINITCGIAIIAVASPMAQEIAGLTPLAAASMVGIMGLFNGAGRIGWASFSDKIGRPLTYILFFGIELACFFLLPRATHPLLFQALVFIILTCYGGGFACVPAYIGDLFGTKQLAAIHGYILTAWAAAGVVGPTIVAWVREATQSYEGTLYIFDGFFVIALLVALLLRYEISRIERQQQGSRREMRVAH
jgi:OFA family oxalate/formate antiporter-like MFS transporter